MPSLEDLIAIAARSKKPLAWYGLAMEYRTQGRFDEAIATFSRVHDIDPSYVPAYFMCAQLHAERGDVVLARNELLRGIDKAHAVGDGHAISEMQSLLATLQERDG